MITVFDLFDKDYVKNTDVNTQISDNQKAALRLVRRGTYYWDCPRCSSLYIENYYVCSCGYNCNDRPLYKK